MTTSFKQHLVLLGDIIILYGCLIVTLFLRYGFINTYLWHAHAGPFAILFTTWIVIFYITGLYNLKNLKNTLELINQVVISIFIGSILALAFFYLIPYFKISPKTNLAIFIIIFTIIELIWRWLFNTWTKKPEKNVLLIGKGDDIEELVHCIIDNPQMGYDIKLRMEDIQEDAIKNLTHIIREHEIDTIILFEHTHYDDEFVRKIYQNVLCGVEIIGAMHTYETILQKLPIANTERLWILTNITKHQRIYDVIMAPLERLIAFIVFIFFLPLMLFIGILVKLTSRGPIIYSQIRLGKDEHPFSIYKFRTMSESAEKNGPQWSTKNDTRVTMLGIFLRASHLDELPQLFNILGGEISFVGPRPERPEFIKNLKTQIPYYEIRHLVRPGITGWAQINYRYGSSTEDAYHKLQYDLFYLKHRSLILDLLIIAKTMKLLFTNAK